VLWDVRTAAVVAQTSNVTAVEEDGGGLLDVSARIHKACLVHGRVVQQIETMTEML
jgi:hypothetical protein